MNGGLGGRLEKLKRPAAAGVDGFLRLDVGSEEYRWAESSSERYPICGPQIWVLAARGLWHRFKGTHEARPEADAQTNSPPTSDHATSPVTKCR